MFFFSSILARLDGPGPAVVHCQDAPSRLEVQELASWHFASVSGQDTCSQGTEAIDGFRHLLSLPNLGFTKKKTLGKQYLVTGYQDG